MTSNLKSLVFWVVVVVACLLIWEFSTNFQRSGNKATWDMQCSGQMPMTGHGEITFESEDAYSGVIDATAEGMTMKINLSGRKLGTCDKPVG